ncbi:MAG: hypothetical protein KDD44_06005 [Bdellovibrionales bacterium]|nr:hypothetical protein [Bdellovibrionales bacterium]
MAQPVEEMQQHLSVIKDRLRDLVGVVPSNAVRVPHTAGADVEALRTVLLEVERVRALARDVGELATRSMAPLASADRLSEAVPKRALSASGVRPPIAGGSRKGFRVEQTSPLGAGNRSFTVLIERSVGGRPKRVIPAAYGDPAAYRIACRLLTEGVAPERVAEKVLVSVTEIRRLDEELRSEWRRQIAERLRQESEPAPVEVEAASPAQLPSTSLARPPKPVEADCFAGNKGLADQPIVFERSRELL